MCTPDVRAITDDFESTRKPSPPVLDRRPGLTHALLGNQREERWSPQAKT